MRQDGRRMVFYAPSFKYFESAQLGKSDPDAFASISITGRRCSLGCEHCRGKLLEDMIPATTPRDLVLAAESLSKKGCMGLLISGGSDKDGRVPLYDFIDSIGEIKHRLGLSVVVHTGYADDALAGALSRADIDCAMFDVIGDDDTLSSVYHLHGGTSLVESTMACLSESGIKTAPHLVCGLNYGKIGSEYEGLSMIRKYSPHAIVFVIITPLSGTPMQGIPVPEPDDVAGLMKEARAMFPDIPLVLGCARPAGKLRKEYDLRALDAGFNAIAFPADETVVRALESGMKIELRSECCSLIVNQA